MAEEHTGAGSEKHGLAAELLDALAAGSQPETFSRLIALLESASQFVDHLADRFKADREPAPAAPGLADKGLLHTLQVILHGALNRPETLARHYGQFAGELLQALRGESELAPDPADRRFKDPSWRDSPFYRGLMQIYLAWATHMQGWVDEQALTAADRQRVSFLFEQVMAALSPSNLPINPAALKRAETSEGESAVLGLRNWLRDLRHHQGMPSQIREDAYALGVDLAVTPGQVVYRNEQLELIQYAAPRVSVHRRPVLLIPPQINKYYIFDLKPRNSIIGHLLRSGLQMFVVSWRNPGADAADWNLDTYVAATLDALEAIRSITRSRTLSLISACAGGFTAMALLGYLAETRQPLVRSHSLLVTALLSHNGSTLELFGTPEAMEMARERCRDQGYMDGRQLARIFAWLRPNDLVWNYWVNNYLMGRSPPPLDVLYWDNDSTRLPAGLQSDFLDMYAREVFEHPRAQRVLGVAVDYRKVKVDTYFAAGREDYLMPWAGVYRAAKLFRGRHSFVLSTSGHVQSILRPPHLARTEYFTNAEMPATPEQWQAGAQRHQGTWWDHWTHWLVTRSGALKRTPRRLGDRAYPPLAPAPGDYVRERS